MSIRGRAGAQDGIALVTTILLVAIMLLLGTAMLSIVDTQTAETRTERVGDAAYNLAEAALNAEAFLLGRNWPQSDAQRPNPAAPAIPCSGQTMNGTLAMPADTPTPTAAEQVQGILAETYEGGDGDHTSTSRWWVTACEEGGRTAWDESLLDGRSFDPSVLADPSPRPRRMWVRAEAEVRGRRRAVVGLVQAGQARVFPPDFALVTGKIGADLTSTLGTLTTGALAGPLLSSLVSPTGTNRPVIEGDIGLRCSLLDANDLLGCLSGVFKATSATTLGPLLQANDYVDFRGDTAIGADQLASMRREAQASGTYFANGAVAAGAACLPAGSAGKIVFIEEVGDGTGSCILDTAGNATARALVVGSGGVIVRGGGTFTGVIYALHDKGLPREDVRIEDGSKVVGGVFVDDNPTLPSGQQRGQFVVVPPPVNLSSLQDNVLCRLPLLGTLVCTTLDATINILGLNTVLGAVLPQLNANLPAVTYDANVAGAVTAFGDSALVTGTFRQVTPRF